MMDDNAFKTAVTIVVMLLALGFGILLWSTDEIRIKTGDKPIAPVRVKPELPFHPGDKVIVGNLFEGVVLKQESYEGCVYDSSVFIQYVTNTGIEVGCVEIKLLKFRQ